MEKETDSKIGGYRLQTPISEEMFQKLRIYGKRVGLININDVVRKLLADGIERAQFRFSDMRETDTDETIRRGK